MKKLFIKAIATILLPLSLASCSDWLKVEMEDKIMEPVLFSNYPGYVSALNGVYLSLNDYYSKGNLMDILDVMAQYYDVTENTTHSYKNYIAFSYKDSGFESVNSSLWNQAYSIIANNNTILDHLQDINNTPLNQKQFNILKGEALALRAMLHFDLVRRHGSIYTLDPDAESICYQDNTKREILPLLSHRQVMEKIIGDLNEAASLLKDYDPIITEGTKDMTTEDNGVASYDMAFRHLRLNYYAVQGLLARAYMWMGDKTNAYRVAMKEVIEKVNSEELNVFPWVTKEQIEASGRPDLIFSSEIMFAMYNSKRYNDIYSNRFSQSLSMSSRLTFYGETMGDSKVALFYDNENDYRRRQWKLVEPSQEEIDKAEEEGRDPKSTLYTTKYGDFEGSVTIDGPTTYRYMVPMIRLSEMYLIAAEATSDTNEAYRLLNEIRLNRLCPDLQEDGNLSRTITLEFAREMIGEGQLFFYYKRRQELLLNSREGKFDYNMSLANYVWPLPESEINKRGTVNNK
ncbi:RagB/SusD family nutrient uptake outer membrane protein [uncultured Duncaniella sp.]|uniref:RagB/SusD family nutrient uptake outer membrane protein n=1 Tax=uncultured Duncaniella sp. TaxID=2768039 RepID=UPI0025A970A1|nr:RagB/SusD family nutrient uptake outer membrane protein [uncultured Duncaniella sp.]